MILQAQVMASKLVSWLGAPDYISTYNYSTTVSDVDTWWDWTGSNSYGSTEQNTFTSTYLSWDEGFGFGFDTTSVVESSHSNSEFLGYTFQNTSVTYDDVTSFWGVGNTSPAVNAESSDSWFITGENEVSGSNWSSSSDLGWYQANSYGGQNASSDEVHAYAGDASLAYYADSQSSYEYYETVDPWFGGSSSFHSESTSSSLTIISGPMPEDVMELIFGPALPIPYLLG